MSINFCKAIALVAFVALCGQVHAASIVVEEEFGFSYSPGEHQILLQGGPSWLFNGDSFAAQYLGDSLVVTAQEDVQIALPYGLGAFRCCVPGIPPQDFIAFIPLVGDFKKGQMFSARLSTVPEPSRLALAVVGLLGATLVLRFSD